MHVLDPNIVFALFFVILLHPNTELQSGSVDCSIHLFSELTTKIQQQKESKQNTVMN